MPYSRRIFLINKKFQLRFSLYVCSWLFALSIIYPMIIYNLYEYLIHYATLDPRGPALTQLQTSKSQVVWYLVLLQALFLSVTFLISILLSHRIAGPLYKLGKFFREVRNGNLNDDLKFRKNDHFQELVEDYNGMMDTIRSTLKKNTDSAAAAISRIEKVLANGSNPIDPQGRRELEEALVALREVCERTPLQ
jgi:methyl-accepting chemotaxis protein